MFNIFKTKRIYIYIHQRTSVSQGVVKEGVQAKFSSSKGVHNQIIKYLPKKAFF